MVFVFELTRYTRMISGRSRYGIAESVRRTRGSIVLRNAAQAELFRFQMNRDEDAKEIQHCRQNCANDDIRIRNADILRHQERRCAHDRAA